MQKTIDRSPTPLQSQRKKQRDEWQQLNFFAKVSKYDLDRANINMMQAQQHKKHVRVVNARARREQMMAEKQYVKN